MYGRYGRGEMARGAKALLAAALTVAFLSTPSRAMAEGAWYRPQLAGGKAFPVLISAESRFLNWRDTFGAPRMRLVGGTWKQVGVHQGIDIYAERGSPVVAMTSGVVENLGWTFYSGWRVGIRGDDGAYYFYAHLLPGSPQGVSRGGKVGAGSVIGYLGSSGYGPEGTADEFPPHLHFGLQRGGQWINAEPQLRLLYVHQIGQITSARTRIRQIEGRMRLVSGRSSGAEPPGPDEVRAALERLAGEKARLDQGLLLR